MKKLFSFLLILTLLALVTGCELKTEGVSVEYGDGEFIVTLNNFVGRHTVKLEHEVPGEGSLYSTATLTEGSVTVSRNDGWLWEKSEMLTVSATDGYVSRADYVDSSVTKINITLTSSAPASGVLRFGFSECEHNYKLLESVTTTCTALGYEISECKVCGKISKVDAESYAPHTYAEPYNCSDRECTTPGCDYVDAASGEHDYSIQYVCCHCGTAKNCSLADIGRDFSEQILNQARINAGDMTGNFEIVVLGAEETTENLKNYIISPELDTSKIGGGLFVKFDVTNDTDSTLFTIYYNFGLQFSDEQTIALEFTYDGADEAWLLEVVEGNKTILFEYSILVSLYE